MSGLLLELGYDFTRRHERRRRLGRGEIQRPPLVIIANTLIFIYSTVIITLSGTHVAPASALDCGLKERWQNLFKHKDASAIRQIQDAFHCCGLITSRDMAWPFPDRTHDSHACEATYRGRTSGCLAAWKAEEQKIAGFFMTVVGMVFIWQVCGEKKTTTLRQGIILTFSGSSPSLPYLPKRNHGFTRWFRPVFRVSLLVRKTGRRTHDVPLTMFLATTATRTESRTLKTTQKHPKTQSKPEITAPTLFSLLILDATTSHPWRTTGQGADSNMMSISHARCPMVTQVSILFSSMDISE